MTQTQNITEIFHALINKAEPINNNNHAGNKIKSVDWSDLYQLCNEAKAVLTANEEIISNTQQKANFVCIMVHKPAGGDRTMTIHSDRKSAIKSMVEYAKMALYDNCVVTMKSEVSLANMDDEAIIDFYTSICKDDYLSINEYINESAAFTAGQATGKDRASVPQTQPITENLPRQDAPQTAKVFVYVIGGVADYLSEGPVEIVVFDKDNFDEGDEFEIPSGFETLIPEVIRDAIEERESQSTHSPVA